MHSTPWKEGSTVERLVNLGLGWEFRLKRSGIHLLSPVFRVGLKNGPVLLCVTSNTVNKVETSMTSCTQMSSYLDFTVSLKHMLW